MNSNRSPKNTRKRKESLSPNFTFSKLGLNRSWDLPTQQSTHLPFDNPNLYSFDALEKNYITKQPKITTEKLAHIQKLVDINETSRQNFQIRIKNNDQYLQYNKNPFLVDTPAKTLESKSVRVKNKSVSNEHVKPYHKKSINIVNYQEQLDQRSKLSTLVEKARQVLQPLPVQKSILMSINKRNKKMASSYTPRGNRFATVSQSEEVKGAFRKINEERKKNTDKEQLKLKLKEKEWGRKTGKNGSRQRTSVQGNGERSVGSGSVSDNQELLVRSFVAGRDKTKDEFDLEYKLVAGRVKEQCEWLDQLVNTQEDNFFWNRRVSEKWNLFDFAKHPESSRFYSNKQFLDKLYFCSESVLKQANTLNEFHINREISRIGRTFIMGKYKEVEKSVEKITESDLYFKMERLGFEDLMVVSSGRLQSKVLDKYMQKGPPNSQLINEQFYDKIKEQQDVEIQYDPQARHRGGTFTMENYYKMQANMLNLRVMNKKEESQKNVTNLFGEQIKSLLRVERELMECGIKDVSIWREIKRKKDHLQKMQNQTVVGKLAAEVEVEKRIRMNKKSKDKTERIKTNILIETVKEKKQKEKINKKRVEGLLGERR